MAATLRSNGCQDIVNLLELCDVPLEKIKMDHSRISTKVPSLTLNSGLTVEGLQTVAVYIASACSINNCSLLGNSPLERAEVHQWLEYRQTHIEQALADKTTSKPVLQDLNSHLSNKVYFAGVTLSLADVMIYYALHSLLSNMMPQDREMYINISRWFHQVQSLLSARQCLPLLSFQRNLLYS